MIGQKNNNNLRNNATIWIYETGQNQTAVKAEESLKIVQQFFFLLVKEAFNEKFKKS